LRELEKRGFLKNGVFTAKGEKWVARRKSGIEAFLARAEQNREAMRLQ
jgi:hypothetical protein